MTDEIRFALVHNLYIGGYSYEKAVEIVYIVDKTLRELKH